MDYILKDSIHFFLNENIENFRSRFLHVIDTLEPEFFTILLSNFVKDDLEINKSYARGLVNNIISNGTRFENLSLKFNLSLLPEPHAFNSRGYKVRLSNYYYWNAHYEKLFFESAQNKAGYEKVSGFFFFEDILIDKKDVLKYKMRNYIFNLKGTEHYILNVVQFFFRDYNIFKKSSPFTRFLKQIDEETFFGFQFNSTKFNRDLKNGKLLTPRFDIVLITNYESGNECVSILNDMVADFFEPPTLLFETHFAYSIFEKVSESHYKLKYDTVYQDIDNFTVRVFNDNNLGEEIKKHMYYYLATLALISKPMLDYYYECIVDALSLE